MRSFWPSLARRLRACTVALALCAAGAALAQPLLVDSRPSIPVWPAVGVLVDAPADTTAAQLVGQAQRFSVPEGTPGNLGRTTGDVWLRVPVQVPGDQPVQRVLEIDYPALNQIDLYQVRAGELVARHRMGNDLRLSERPLPTRSHAVALTLPPGDSVLLLRARTRSSMVLPMTLRTQVAFTAQESQSQLVLGVITGLALCMLVYSLTHWVSLRDTMFLDYALLLSCNAVFTMSLFGIASQYLWPDSPRWASLISPLAVLLAVTAGTRFMRAALAVHEVSPAIERLLQGAGLVALAAVVGGAFGWLGYSQLQALAIVLGLIAGIGPLPVAYVRARRGERIAGYILFGWAFYVLGALTTAALLRGYVEPTFFSLYLYPISTMIEMSAWMAVLGLRVQAIHRNAERARVETEALRALADTDALTGLPNRRGLQARLALALQHSNPQQLLAVYLLDLDGFKPVNDRWGHDVGDALLVAVGQRLQAQLRGSDVVARLGGDEFVVLAGGLADEATAHLMGQKLLATVNAPFDVADQRCEVGLTVGYALAPLDGHTADELLKRADAAMYAGKQAGRRRVQRGGRSLVAA